MIKSHQFEVKGLRVEQYVGETVKGHNCDFIYEPQIMDKYHICFINSKNEKFEATLHTEEGECSSGWTTASWGFMTVKKVNTFGGFTHIPNSQLPLLIPSFDFKGSEIQNAVFTLSHDGGDKYYPSGYVSVNMDLFIANKQAKEKRPVWIFKGGSGLGKSYLSGMIKEKRIYETDTNEKLDETIYADIVVIGNKYSFKIEDVISRLFGEVEVILVDFSQYGEFDSTIMSLTGTVKWFNGDKGFGFIEESVSGQDFFVKKSDINTVDQSLDKGDLVDFKGSKSMNGWTATQVYLKL